MTSHNWKEIRIKKNDDDEIGVWHCLRCDTYAFRDRRGSDIFYHSLVSSYTFNTGDVQDTYIIDPDCDLCIVGEVNNS